MSPRLLHVVGLCLFLFLLGCQPAQQWKYGKSTYEYTPGKLRGAWSNGVFTVEFRGDRTLTWNGVPGKYRFDKDGALVVVPDREPAGYLTSTSFKYTVKDDKLILVGNQDGTWTEFTRSK